VQWFIGDQGMQIGAPQFSCAVLPHITSDTPTYQLSPHFKGQALANYSTEVPTGGGQHGQTLLTSLKGQTPFNSMEVSFKGQPFFQGFDGGANGRGPTQSNPADLTHITRNNSNNDINVHLWWKGLHWLTKEPVS
jgi:hypothetical protein